MKVLSGEFSRIIVFDTSKFYNVTLYDSIYGLFFIAFLMVISLFAGETLVMLWFFIVFVCYFAVIVPSNSIKRRLILLEFTQEKLIAHYNNRQKDFDLEDIDKICKHYLGKRNGYNQDRYNTKLVLHDNFGMTHNLGEVEHEVYDSQAFIKCLEAVNIKVEKANPYRNFILWNKWDKKKYAEKMKNDE